jgi:hypothetical protein
VADALSTPAFAAVPAAARRHSLAGHALLPLAGVANTLLGMKLFGSGAMVELFLLPCLLLAVVLFRSSERRVMATLLASAIAYVALDGALGAPVASSP